MTKKFYNSSPENQYYFEILQEDDDILNISSYGSNIDQLNPISSISKDEFNRYCFSLGNKGPSLSMSQNPNFVYEFNLKENQIITNESISNEDVFIHPKDPTKPNSFLLLSNIPFNNSVDLSRYLFEKRLISGYQSLAIKNLTPINTNKHKIRNKNALFN